MDYIYNKYTFRLTLAITSSILNAYFSRWFFGNSRSEAGNWGCWAGFARPTPPYLPPLHGDSQRALKIEGVAK